MIKAIIQDELGNVSPSLPFRQGESKTLKIFLVDQNGVPQVIQSADAAEIVFKIFIATGQSNLVKKLSLSQLTALTGLGGTIGIQVALSPTDTPQLPVSATVNASLTFEDSATPTSVIEVDIPSAFSITAPIV